MKKNLIKVIALVLLMAPACITRPAGDLDKKISVGRLTQILNIASRVISVITNIFSQVTQPSQPVQPSQLGQSSQPVQISQQAQVVQAVQPIRPIQAQATSDKEIVNLIGTTGTF